MIKSMSKIKIRKMIKSKRKIKSKILGRSLCCLGGSLCCLDGSFCSLNSRKKGFGCVGSQL
jgi:hypothetical protein